jgi:hypothetical protein
MNIANQNSLQECPHNIHKVDFLEKQCNAAMKNCSALSNLNMNNPNKILAALLTFVVCLLLQMKTVEKTSWQEQNQGKCKSDIPCLVQRV